MAVSKIYTALEYLITDKNHTCHSVLNNLTLKAV